MKKIFKYFFLFLISLFGLILIAPEDREWVKCSDEKDLYRYVYNGWKIDKVIKILKRKRGIPKEIMVVTGRADICLILNSSIDEINKMVIDFKKIKEVVSTETLIEVEVDLGW